MKKFAIALMTITAAMVGSTFAQDAAPAPVPAAPAAAVAPAAAPAAEPAPAPAAEVAPAAAPVAEAPAAEAPAAEAVEAPAPTEEEIAAAEAAKKAEEEKAAAEAKKAEEERLAAEAAKKAEEEKAAAEAAKKAEEEKAAAEAAKKAEAEKAAAVPSELVKRVGVSVSAAFGMFNVQFTDDHFKDIPVNFGIDGLVGKGMIAGRLHVGMEYHNLYVNEGSNRNVNEGYWRLGLGLFAHIMPMEKLFVEVGANLGIPTSNDIVIQQYAGSYATNVFAPQTSVNVEASVGYSLNLGPMPLDVSAYFNHDVMESMAFKGDVDGYAWHLGARATFWILDL